MTQNLRSNPRFSPKMNSSIKIVDITEYKMTAHVTNHQHHLRTEISDSANAKTPS